MAIGFATAFGDANAVPKLDYVYRLPIPDNVRGVVRAYSGAAVNTPFVHTANAVEVLLSPGTPVVATRAGTVIATSASVDPYPPPTHSHIGNYISVLHDDGTWGLYGWLADGSISVSVGDAVKPGQQIALSGSNPDSYETYVMFAVVRNLFGLQLKSLPIVFAAAGGELIDVLTFSGQVSPNLTPKYHQAPKNEVPFVPPESMVPLPKIPVDWDDEHLTPDQRHVLFRQRLMAAAEASGSDTVSGSRPLIFLAISAALVGTIGVILALSSHGSSKTSGLRGVVWTLFRGRPPSSMPPPVTDSKTTAMGTGADFLGSMVRRDVNVIWPPCPRCR